MTLPTSFDGWKALLADVASRPTADQFRAIGDLWNSATCMEEQEVLLALARGLVERMTIVSRITEAVGIRAAGGGK